MLIPSPVIQEQRVLSSLSRGMNANSQRNPGEAIDGVKSIKRDEC